MVIRRPVRAICVALVLAIGAVFLYSVFLEDDGKRLLHFPVTWELAGPVGPSDTDVVLDMGPGKCAGGVPTAERLSKVKVDYAPDSITIAVTAHITVPGVYACPKPIPDRVTVHLEEPVGSRRLVDGNAGTSPAGTFPAP